MPDSDQPAAPVHIPTSKIDGPDGRPLSQWRRDQRRQLVLRRQNSDPEQRKQWNQGIETHLRRLLPEAAGTSFALYWPRMGEFTIGALMHELHANGGITALPDVVAPKQPLQFRIWHPDVAMQRGALSIPTPAGTPTLIPDVLMVPLLGFDKQGYRLGFGGGFYDRTLGSYTHDPMIIGVGYALSAIDSIYPQTHDIPMQYIVTENGITRY